MKEKKEKLKEIQGMWKEEELRRRQRKGEDGRSKEEKERWKEKKEIWKE